MTTTYEIAHKKYKMAESKQDRNHVNIPSLPTPALIAFILRFCILQDWFAHIMLRVLKSTIRIADEEASDYYTLVNRHGESAAAPAQYCNRFPDSVVVRNDIVLLFGPLHGERCRGKTAEHGITMEDLWDIAEAVMERLRRKENLAKVAIIEVPTELPEGVTKLQCMEDMRNPQNTKVFYARPSEFEGVYNRFPKKLPTEEIAMVKDILFPLRTPEGQLLLNENLPTEFAPDMPQLSF